ncbi:MaoC/PaaZ C-terminal domain-containing protein [Magnetospira sp. QH-2]|uniref:MaoC family dehydratase n=1 Tax=Magnetospira sp. (strain QH-2) TaxID=1288970 RepID=UPI0003E80F40|nr:MaoC/PaaZ C-terminal domain-containing protein [Magnetospira sp. QH-2]CCQ75512.1 conserved protein of unknown function[Include MaoC like domain] [Magnetospira sp. QH-2]
MTPSDDHMFLVEESTPARTLTMEEISAGMAVTQRFVFTEQAMIDYARFANDLAPIHWDPLFAREYGYEAPIIQGLAVVSRFSRLIGMYLPGSKAVIQSTDFKFRRPTMVGDELTYKVKVAKIVPMVRLVKVRLEASKGEDLHVEGWCQCRIGE